MTQVNGFHLILQAEKEKTESILPINDPTTGKKVNERGRLYSQSVEQGKKITYYPPDYSENAEPALAWAIYEFRTQNRTVSQALGRLVKFLDDDFNYFDHHNQSMLQESPLILKTLKMLKEFDGLGKENFLHKYYHSIHDQKLGYDGREIDPKTGFFK
jgi:hypothetical protein